MPYFTSSEEWQRQSSLLIRAQPSTTHITTKYNIPNLTSDRHLKKQQLRAKRKAAKQSASAPDDAATSQADTVSAATSTPTSASADAAPKTPKATFELKTYDPVTGVTLKYRTDKAAEVGRLIAATGRLARDMVGLPEEDPSMLVASAAAEVKDVAAAVAGEAVDAARLVADTVKTAVAGAAAATKGAEPGNKKKKKKGKK